MFDELIAAMARDTLWLTDAYFVGVAPYVQALRAAAMTLRPAVLALRAPAADQ